MNHPTQPDPSSTSTTAVIDTRAVVSPLARVGAGCHVGPGAFLGPGVHLDREVTVGANVVFVDADTPADATQTRVQDGVRIGPNATIYAGTTLAAGCVVRPGAVVTRSVPPRAIVDGNPATIIGYVGTESGATEAQTFALQKSRGIETTPVRGVTVHTFSVVPDLRGNLTVGEFVKEIPFVPMRYFMVFDVPSREVRGEHAHHECHQFLICVRGSCAVVADDGERRIEVALDAPHRGLYLPPKTWATQYKYSSDALLLVFASHHYDSADYIRVYADYLDLVCQTN